jgi:hypothetical protein
VAHGHQVIGGVRNSEMAKVAASVREGLLNPELAKNLRHARESGQPRL